MGGEPPDPKEAAPLSQSTQIYCGDMVMVIGIICFVAAVVPPPPPPSGLPREPMRSVEEG